MLDLASGTPQPFFKKFYVYRCLSCVYTCTTYVCSAQRGQKRYWILWNGSHVVAGTELGSSTRVKCSELLSHLSSHTLLNIFGFGIGHLVEIA